MSELKPYGTKYQKYGTNLTDASKNYAREKAQYTIEFMEREWPGWMSQQDQARVKTVLFMALGDAFEKGYKFAGGYL